MASTKLITLFGRKVEGMLDDPYHILLITQGGGYLCVFKSDPEFGSVCISCDYDRQRFRFDKVNDKGEQVDGFDDGYTIPMMWREDEYIYCKDKLMFTKNEIPTKDELVVFVPSEGDPPYVLNMINSRGVKIKALSAGAYHNLEFIDDEWSQKYTAKFMVVNCDETERSKLLSERKHSLQKSS